MSLLQRSAVAASLGRVLAHSPGYCRAPRPCRLLLTAASEHRGFANRPAVTQGGRGRAASPGSNRRCASAGQQLEAEAVTVAVSQSAVMSLCQSRQSRLVLK